MFIILSKDEMIVAQKALTFDIRQALKESSKETYTAEEIIEFIDKIIKAKEQAP